MKHLYLIIILSINSSWAVTQCELFDNEQLQNLTTLSIPNCLTEDNIYNELESRSASSSGGVICGTCKDQLTARVQIGNEDKIRIRKQAYLETMLSEYKKTMSKLITDMISIRKLYTTGSSFNSSQTKCSAQNFQRKIQACSPFVKSFFEQNKISQLIPNEIASLLSNSQINPSLLDRSSPNQCSITDEQIISLKPLLLDRAMTPQTAQLISNFNPTSKDDLWNLLNDRIPEDLLDLIRQNPILTALAEQPSEFINFFRTVSRPPQRGSYEDFFRNALYSPRNGDKIDVATANRCEQAINSFTDKVCSSDFNNGNISLGPIEGFERYNNGRAYPEGEALTSEDSLAKNVALLEFCAPINGSALSLAKDSNAINDWMRTNERQQPYINFSSTQHNEKFETPRNKVCADLNSTRCDSEPAKSDVHCRLKDLFLESKQEGTLANRIANNPDSSVNKVLRAFVGNPQGLPEQTKQVLIAEGILPQSNGQFVERPEIPERQPEYLAGVANGTITPNAGGSTVQSQASRTPPRRPSQSQTQAQVFQPGQGNSAVPETQLAENSEGDAEALRRFEEGLDERLRRVEGQQTTNNNRRTQTTQRPASRGASSGRTSDRSQTANFIPSQQAEVPTQITGGGSTVAAAAVVPEARLGQDTSRRGLADRQRNEALANMNGARINPSVTAEAGRSPANAEGTFQPESSLTLNIDSNANLERVLTSNENLRALIQEQKPFRFRLNNSVFDVRFSNGSYTVAFRSGGNNGQTLASTLQGIFNNSLRRSPSADRNATLQDLNNTVRN